MVHNFNKFGMNNEEIIEKAHKVGDPHPKGKNLVWTEYKPGKFDWRPPKKVAAPAAGNSGGNAPAGGGNAPVSKQNDTGGSDPKKLNLDGKSFGDLVAGMTPDQIVDAANSAITAQLEAAVNDKKNDKDLRQLVFNVLKTRDDYDKTKVDSADLNGGYFPKKQPRVQYKTKKPEVEIEITDEWYMPTPGKNGTTKNVKVTASGQRRLYAGYDDDKLLGVINNKNGNWQNRHLAYEEAAARGIDESKLDVSGKLQKEWDRQKNKAELQKRMSANVNPDEADAITIDFKGLDHEAFMEEFPDGDLGWLDPRDPRVQKKFGGFKTLTSRQQYDAFKSFYEPSTPGYLNPENKVGKLFEQYDNLIRYNTDVLFVSAGGAGAGKTFGWKTVANENNLVELTDDEHAQDQDWGWTMCSDPEDEKDFRATLAKFNGTWTDDFGKEHPHILVFDDADKILTTRGGAMKALMKKITDNDKNARYFVNPTTGEKELFKGAIVIMTNKNMAAIQAASEDAKAIVSRGTVSDIQFTRLESMTLINQRWKSMGLSDYQEAFENQFPDEDDQMEVRSLVRDWIEDNLNDADPAKFTPRTFINVMKCAGTAIAKEKRGTGAVRYASNGVQIGTTIPWQIEALNLIKGETIDFEKADDDDEFTEEGAAEIKKEFLKRKSEAKKKDKKRYDAIYGKSAMDAFLFGDDKTNNSDSDNDDNDETEKAFESNFDMTLEDAENLLLG